MQPAPGLRGKVELASYPVLTRLAGGPRWVPALVMGALVLGGLAAPPVVGAVLLVLATLIVLWLTYLSWPALRTTGRLFRGLLIGMLVGGIVMRFTQR